jgi:hypothetical protein
MRRAGDNVTLVFSSYDMGRIMFFLPDILNPHDQIDGFFSRYELSRACNEDIQVKHIAPIFEADENGVIPTAVPGEEDEAMLISFGSGSKIVFQGASLVRQIHTVLHPTNPAYLREKVYEAAREGLLSVTITEARL